MLDEFNASYQPISTKKKLPRNHFLLLLNHGAERRHDVTEIDDGAFYVLHRICSLAYVAVLHFNQLQLLIPVHRLLFVD